MTDETATPSELVAEQTENAAQIATSSEAVAPTDATPMQVAAGPTRTAADGYAFAAVTCAATGLLLPLALFAFSGRRALAAFAIVVFTAPVALMLARATEEPVAPEPVSPSVARTASVAQTLAYASVALVVTFCAAMLGGILFELVIPD